MTNFELSRKFFDWMYENPDVSNPNMVALYCWLLEKWNRAGSPEKLSVTVTESMCAIGIRNYKTYKKTFDDLVNYGFVKVLVPSKNQFTCNVIALVKNTIATTKALDKALTIAPTKALTTTPTKANTTLIKPINQQTNKPINNIIGDFEMIWNMYQKKVGDKAKLQKKLATLPPETIEQIKRHIPVYVLSTPDPKYRKNLETYLNNKSWQDEIYQNNNNGNSNYRENTLNQLDAVFAAKYGN